MVSKYGEDKEFHPAPYVTFILPPVVSTAPAMALMGIPESTTPTGTFMDTSVIGPSPAAITQYV
jgi:hypothetical protein